jgi:NDP-sugar pyrophosphorylase family protein
MRAIILAAGKGKRLVALTQHCPKSLIPVGGVPILSRFLGALEAVGIKDIVIVVGYLEEKMTQFIKDSHPHLNIQTTVNPDYLRGSILSLWAAREFFNDDLLIIDAFDKKQPCHRLHQKSSGERPRGFRSDGRRHRFFENFPFIVRKTETDY